MAKKQRVGIDCFTYWSKDTTYEAPTWILTDLIKDESIDLTKSRAEFAARYSRFKRKKGALAEAPASLQVEYRVGDAFIDALIESFLDNVTIDMAFAFDDITVTGTEYFRMPIEVFDMPVSRNLEDGVMIDVEVELTEFVKADGSLADLEWLVIP